MSRYRRNFNTYNNYYNYNYNYYDNFPDIARLSYGLLNKISRRTRKSINPGVFDPNEKRRHFKINCHASFECHKCRNIWTSNQVTVELWWNFTKTEFDVRLYGQQCKRCNYREYNIPYISGVEYVIDICVKVLTNNYHRDKKMNANKNTNTEFNSSHDQRRCQKCQILHHPCWQEK